MRLAVGAIVELIGPDRAVRFGGREPFLALLAQVRAAAPAAGVRSNVIVGFPGETEDDLAELEAFLVEARLDAVGVFGCWPPWTVTGGWVWICPGPRTKPRTVDCERSHVVPAAL